MKTRRTQKEKADLLRALAELPTDPGLLERHGATGADLKAALLEAADTLLRRETIKHNELIIHVDGASRGNPGPSSAGVVIKDSGGRLLAEESVYLGLGTNNQAEYKALILALESARRLGAAVINIFSDSELLVRQMEGQYKVKQPHLRELFSRADEISKFFSKVSYRHVPREQNRRADALANAALDRR